MTLTKYFITLIIATVLAWGGWAVVLMQINPETAAWDGFLLFYVSLFLALVGTFSVLGLSIRLHTQHQHLPYYLVLLSFRQAIFFSLLVTGALLLQGHRWLHWWNVLMLLAGLTVIEFLMLSAWRRPNRG